MSGASEGGEIQATESASVDPAKLISRVDSAVKKITTDRLNITFNEILSMYESQELIINPEYQRMFRWSPGKQSRFIESLILGLPIPPIFLLEKEDMTYELIDGLQRVSTYLNLRGQLPGDIADGGPLRLTECDLVPELNDLTYEDLPTTLKIRLKRYWIHAEIVKSGSDKEISYYMFKRLNTGGVDLSEQEIRNCTLRLLDPEICKFIIACAELESFRACTECISEEGAKQKLPEELCLRFFAFKNNGTDYKHEIGDFLTEYIEDVAVDKLPWNQMAETETFQKTFDLLAKAAALERADSQSLLEGRIFGSVRQDSCKATGQFSSYHYDTITQGIQCIIEKMDPSDDDHIKQVHEAIWALKFDPEFLHEVGGGKNYRGPHYRRLAVAERHFQEATSE